MRELRLGLAVLALAGCAEVPFSVHTNDNDPRTLAAALARMAPPAPGPRNGSGHAMAYVVAGAEGKDRTLYAYDLDEGKVVFETPADVRSRFAVGRGFVAYREGADELVVRDGRDGRVRARVRLDPGQQFMGLAADERVYYVTRRNGAGPRESRVAAIGPDGLALWSVAAPGSVGAPAAQGGLVAVPYRYQYVVLLDGRTGTELARVREKDEQIGFVRAAPAGFLYGVGDKGVALLNERSVHGVKDQISYLAPQLGDRVRVFLYWDGYRAEQADFSAFDRNRLLWDAAPEGQALVLKDDVAVLHSYRFMFAVPGHDGPLRWAYAHPRQNMMASADTGPAVVYVAQDGEVGALDMKNGARRMAQRLPLKPGQQVLGVTLDAAGFQPRGEEAQAAAPLQVLHDIVFDKDSSFIAIKVFAVQAIRGLPGRDAAAELVRIVTAEAMPGQVTRAAGEALVARQDRDVTDLIVRALEQRYDFLDNRQPRGIGLLARAAAALGAKEAVPALARQMQDPTTPPAVLKEIIAALVKLGDPGAIRPLRELVLMYRADPLFVPDPEPLKMAGEGLLKLGGEAERMAVDYVAEEPRTSAALAAYYRKILDESASARVPAPPAKP